jgi:hypothetical protein
MFKVIQQCKKKELDRLRSILQFDVNNGLQIVCKKKQRNINWHKIIYFAWNSMFLISLHINYLDLSAPLSIHSINKM